MPLPDTHQDSSAVQPSIDAIVRPATIYDVAAIHHLIEGYAEMGNLLPRPMNEIYRHLRDFFVAEHQNKIVACGALEIFTETLAEVRSLVVDSQFNKLGLGRKLVEGIIEEARLLGLKQLMALTYVPDFFHKLDFKTVPKDTLPEKVWGICIKCYKYDNCDEIAVLRDLGRTGS